MAKPNRRRKTSASGRAQVRFCETCGKPVRPAPTLLKDVPRELPGDKVWGLQVCADCDVHACKKCWAGAAGACPACGVRVDVAPQVLLPPDQQSVDVGLELDRWDLRQDTQREPIEREQDPGYDTAAMTQLGYVERRRTDLRLVMTAVAAVFIVSTLAVIIGGLPLPAGGVLGESASPLAAVPTSRSARPSRPASPAPTSLRSSLPSGGAASAPPNSPTPGSGATSQTPTRSDRQAVVVAEARFRGWSEPSSVTRGQVLAVVENATTDWVRLPTGRSTYTILDREGTRTASGAFGHAFPQRLPPGGRAYLIDFIDASFADLVQLHKVTVEPVFERSDPVADGIVVIDLAWNLTDIGGLSASGRVSNTSPTEAHDLVIAAVFLDAAGAPLAVIYEPQPLTLAQGESRAFATTYPDAGPLQAADIARVETIAAPLER